MDEMTLAVVTLVIAFVVSGIYALYGIATQLSDISKFVLSHPRPYIVSYNSTNKTLTGYGTWEEGVLFIIKNGEIKFISYKDKVKLK